jgi:hypothetical protein
MFKLRCKACKIEVNKDWITCFNCDTPVPNGLFNFKLNRLWKSVSNFLFG